MNTMHVIRHTYSSLILGLLSLPVFAADQAVDGETRSAISPIGEAQLPANPARLQVLGRGLEFPVRNARAITKIRAYGVRPWGHEPVHNGVDLVVDNSGALLSAGDKVAILSSATGTIRAVLEIGDRGDILVVIEVNPGLYVNYNLEPQTENVSLRELQAASIDVSVGQRVRAGQKIADLVVGEGEEPHVDMSLLLFDPALVDPEDPIGYLMTQIISHNDVANLPTFLCAYDYSSVRAKTTYEKILQDFNPESQCVCPCRFPYNAAECGTVCGD